MRLLLLFIFFSTAQSVFATNTSSGKINPASTSTENPSQQAFLKYYPELNASYKPEKDSADFEHLKRKAKWSKWLGIGAIAGIFIPGLIVLSIPAAIISLVLAGQVKKEALDKGILKDAGVGKTTSIIALALIVVAAIVAVVVLATFLGGWR